MEGIVLITIDPILDAIVQKENNGIRVKYNSYLESNIVYKTTVIAQKEKFEYLLASFTQIYRQN